MLKFIYLPLFLFSFINFSLFSKDLKFKIEANVYFINGSADFYYGKQIVDLPIPSLDGYETNCYISTKKYTDEPRGFMDYEFKTTGKVYEHWYTIAFQVEENPFGINIIGCRYLKGGLAKEEDAPNLNSHSLFKDHFTNKVQVISGTFEK